MVREDACECCAEGPRTQVTRFHDESQGEWAAQLYSLPKKKNRRKELWMCVDGTGSNVTGRDPSGDRGGDRGETGEPGPESRRETRLKESEDQR